MRKALLFHCIALVSTVALAEIGRAEPAYFDADQLHEIDLVPRQSTGGSMRSVIESLGANAPRFEPVSMLREDDPYRQLGRTIGRLSYAVVIGGVRRTAVCTAALIAPDRIITNAHCIPGDEGRVDEATVRFGYFTQGDTGSAAFTVDVKPIDADRRLDFSILKVHGNPASRYPVLQRTIRSAQDNESLYILHHPGGQPQRLTRAFCRAFPQQATGNDQIKHQCDTLPGSSGSLIFAAIDGAIVGLHHSGGLAMHDSTSFNRGSDINALRGRSQAIAAALGSIPAPRPAQRQAPPSTALALVPMPPATVPMPAPGEAPSFDCATSTRDVEQVICASAALSRLDRELAESYAALRNALDRNAADQLRSSQVSWLARREACATNASCIEALYQARMLDLRSLQRSLARAPAPVPMPTVMPTPPAPSSNSGMITRRANQYFDGEGYAKYRGSSWNDCVNRCTADRTCVAIEFYKPSSDCNLYAHTPAGGASKDADIGLKSGAASSYTPAALPSVSIERQPNRYFDGEGYAKTKNSNWPDCVSRCMTDGRCLALEFFRPRNECNLYDRIPSGGTSREADVGLKRR